MASTNGAPSTVVADTLRPYTRGYKAPDATRGLIARAHETRLARTVATVVFDHLVIVAVNFAAVLAWLSLPWPLAALALALDAAIIGRQLRALECLVHEASHHNWSRRHRRLNDVVASVLACSPTGALLAEYRRSHLVHHRDFGTDLDPDLRRYRELSIEDLDRLSPRRFVSGLARRFTRYQRGWLQMLGARPSVLLPIVVWIGVWTVMPVLLLVPGRPGVAPVVAGVAACVLAYAIVTPTIRLVGEAAEHRYFNQSTVWESTISNLGALHRLLLHPHGDGYHNVHHMWPGVPHHASRRLHNLMTRFDPDAYGLTVNARTSVFMEPVKFRPAK